MGMRINRFAPVIPVIVVVLGWPGVQAVAPDRLAPEDTASAPLWLPEGLPPPPWRVGEASDVQRTLN